MSEYLAINDAIAIPRGELNLSFSRSPGPGGQNVNKVNSKATLRWAYGESVYLPEEVKARFAKLCSKRINDAGEVLISSSRYREQRRNVEDCFEKLRQLVLAASVVPRVRRRPKKSAAANAERLKEKRERSARKQARRMPRMDD